MKILISGASSFIGQHLTPLLSDHDLTFLVRKKGRFSNEVVWNFKEPLPKSLPSCKAVIHLAAYAEFNQNFNPEIYLVNTLATTELVAYSRQNESKLIFTSIAGMNAESFPNHYAVSKFLAESVITSQLKDYSIARISGVYGLEGPSHLGLNVAIRKAFLEKTPPTLRGPGNGLRNYICVKDVARWLVSLLNERKSSTLTLAGSETLSIRAYLEKLSEILLDSNALQIEPGEESKSVVIKSDLAPFPLTSFSNYLKSLRRP